MRTRLQRRFSLSWRSFLSGCCSPFWGSPKAPKGGLSFHHVALHQYSFSSALPTVPHSPATNNNSCWSAECKRPSEWAVSNRKHTQSSNTITQAQIQRVNPTENTQKSVLFSETLTHFQSATSSCWSNSSITHYKLTTKCVCVQVPLPLSVSDRWAPKQAFTLGGGENTHILSLSPSDVYIFLSQLCTFDNFPFLARSDQLTVFRTVISPADRSCQHNEVMEKTQTHWHYTHYPHTHTRAVDRNRAAFQ